MKNKIALLENLVVESYANEGKCIAHYDGKVVFVKGSIPGETVNVRIVKSKKDWMEGETTEVVLPSPFRRIPFCEHFGYCGGCQWQHMAYEAQLQHKQQAVYDTLERLGKLTIGEKLAIVPADDDRHYRNKLEFTFTHREWQMGDAWRNRLDDAPHPALGYHLPGFFDRVFQVNHCHLQPPLSDRIRTAIQHFCLEHGYEFYHLKHHRGFMRTLMIRMTTTGEVMVLVVFAEDDHTRMATLMDFLKQQFPEITSLQYAVNRKGNDALHDLDIITWNGKDTIEERLNGLRFRISAKSFFQTNTRQAARLYDCIKEFAGLHGDELLYDLYTGTGSIALYLAGSARQVIGLEYVAQAIEDAKTNAQLNDIVNVSFHVADLGRMKLQDFYTTYGKPQVVITDPPRAGMAAGVIHELLELAAQKIIYVSCNVATQARDLQMMTDKYEVARIRPFDLFPQTHHVENVAELVLK